MAAIFDLPVTPTSESIHICPAVLPDLKIGGTLWKVGDFTFAPRHHIYIRSDGRHFDFLWTWLKIVCYLRHQKRCACDSPPIGENRMENFLSVPEIQEVQLLHPSPGC